MTDIQDPVFGLSIYIMSFEHPELTEVQTNRQIRLDTIYAFDVLNVYHQAFKMHQRRVLKKNDWYSWLHWMKNFLSEKELLKNIGKKSKSANGLVLGFGIS